MRTRSLLLLFAILPLAVSASSSADSLKLVLLLRTTEDTARVNTLNELGALYAESDPDSAIIFAAQARTLAERLSFKSGLAEALRVIGYGHMGKQDHGIAVTYLERSLSLWAELGDIDKQQRVHFALAHCAEQQSELPEALEHYLASLKFAEQLGDSASVPDMRMNVGVVYERMGETDKALSAVEQVLRHYERVGDSLGIARACNNMGNMLDGVGRHNEARVHLNRAADLARTLGHPMGEAITMGSLANHYQLLEQYDTALVYNEKILSIFERIGDRYSCAAACINTGEILTRLKRYDEARTFLQRGIEHARAVGAKQWLANAHGGLYDIANALGDDTEALEQFKLHIDYRDSISNEANTRKTVQVQMQYDFDKKEAATMAEQEKKDQRQRLVRNGIAGGLAGALLFLGVVWRQRNKISKARKRSDELLLNILPEEVAEELKAKGEAEAVQIDQVTVLFTDFKGFTAMSERVTPKELVKDLHECFSAFDLLCEEHGLEKIKTIGDAYMAAGGLPTPNTTHATDVIRAALRMRAFIAEGKAHKIAAGLPYFEIRIGIHTGPVVAGIVGVKKFQYDIWGDTVNTASRMESSGEVGQVNISEATFALVKDDASFAFTPRGKVQAKGKGEMEMYFVERISNSMHG